MRPTCFRCLRPAAFCYCDLLPRVESRTRIVILQHPREARLAICSAWMAHLALPNSEVHRGVRFSDDPRVRELAATPGAAVLFPGEGSTPARVGEAPSVLFVIDGTWHQAERMVRDPLLRGLPRVEVPSPGESGYGALRREPGEGCLSTIEAVALALGAMEGDAARFAPVAAAFRASVERQLACATGARRNPRHRGAQDRADVRGRG
jgi:DTW domain-containing protein YfiP